MLEQVLIPEVPEMLAHVIPTDDSFLEDIEDKEDSISRVEQLIDLEVLVKKLQGIIAHKLSPREREVVSYVYGLGDFPMLRPFEVALKLNISRGTVAYYLKRAFLKLNDAFVDDIHYYEEII